MWGGGGVAAGVCVLCGDQQRQHAQKEKNNRKKSSLVGQLLDVRGQSPRMGLESQLSGEKTNIDPVLMGKPKWIG